MGELLTGGEEQFRARDMGAPETEGLGPEDANDALNVMEALEGDLDAYLDRELTVGEVVDSPSREVTEGMRALLELAEEETRWLADLPAPSCSDEESEAVVTMESVPVVIPEWMRANPQVSVADPVRMAWSYSKEAPRGVRATRTSEAPLNLQERPWGIPLVPPSEQEGSGAEGARNDWDGAIAPGMSNPWSATKGLVAHGSGAQASRRSRDVVSGVLLGVAGVGVVAAGMLVVASVRIWEQGSSLSAPDARAGVGDARAALAVGSVAGASVNAAASSMQAAGSYAGGAAGASPSAADVRVDGLAGSSMQAAGSYAGSAAGASPNAMGSQVVSLAGSSPHASGSYVGGAPNAMGSQVGGLVGPSPHASGSYVGGAAGTSPSAAVIPGVSTWVGIGSTGSVGVLRPVPSEAWSLGGVPGVSGGAALPRLAGVGAQGSRVDANAHPTANMGPSNADLMARRDTQAVKNGERRSRVEPPAPVPTAKPAAPAVAAVATAAVQEMTFDEPDTSNDAYTAPADTGDDPDAANEPESELDEEFARELGFTAEADAQAEEDTAPTRTVYVPPALEAKQHLTPDDVKQVVLANQPAITTCLRQHAADTSAEKSGRFVMRWSVQPSGETTNVGMDTQALRATPLAGCIEGVVRGWKFPVHTVRMQEPIRFPFVF
ncbi:AgmX/PglI C-terminal domain-containing protein [Myxococcus sp. K38C18041901]|uniref:AgmX/PglI C-terminal domain-containing protein n=1 Tax=Myxococcus guangdongensis TaxID=2906760 RepID=UPI0020A81D5A|nr:AgmX/PglI C-terminal domain-containing protein [Myxococcus guangdongensis]MCP3065467.1 AgmX/PglI C-terminal domain-containing protein [Myxococcus guangdongensis]